MRSTGAVPAALAMAVASITAINDHTVRTRHDL
jgi:hypothetical protein